MTTLLFSKDRAVECQPESCQPGCITFLMFVHAERVESLKRITRHKHLPGPNSQETPNRDLLPCRGDQLVYRPDGRRHHCHVRHNIQDRMRKRDILETGSRPRVKRIAWPASDAGQRQSVSEDGDA